MFKASIARRAVDEQIFLMVTESMDSEHTALGDRLEGLVKKIMGCRNYERWKQECSNLNPDSSAEFYGQAYFHLLRVRSQFVEQPLKDLAFLLMLDLFISRGADEFRVRPVGKKWPWCIILPWLSG